MASYTKLNVQTVTEMLAQNANAQVTAWVMRALMLGKRECPFYDNFIGGEGSGKAFIEKADMNVTAGNTLVITTLARLGGPGRQGNAERTGYEEKMRQGSFTTKTGRMWFGTALDSIAKNETLIGTQWDAVRNELLGLRMNQQKSDDLQMELIIKANERNTIYPNNKASVEALRSADTVTVDTVTDSGVQLSLLGAKGMNVAKSGAGARYNKYMVFGAKPALAPMKKTTKYLDAIQLAGERGATNPGFTGDFVDLDGHGIYAWDVEDHDAYGPIGAPILPRAVLGTAITAGTTTFDITGGGNTAGAAVTPAPLYFGYFSNAAWIGCEGQKRAAVTNVTRYCLIQNVSGADRGKFGFYSFQVNDGNKLTVLKRLASADAGAAALQTIGGVTWDTGVWSGKHTDAHPSGSLIMECNSYGQPFCYGFVLGEHAAVCGHANIDGKLGIGRRTEEHRNHDLDHAIGLETAWGSAVTKGTDDQPRNYLLMVMAYNPPGLPTIT